MTGKLPRGQCVTGKSTYQDGITHGNMKALFPKDKSGVGENLFQYFSVRFCLATVALGKGLSDCQWSNPAECG